MKQRSYRRILTLTLALLLSFAAILPGAWAEGEAKADSLAIEGGEGVTLSYWIPMDSYQLQQYNTLAEHPYFIWLEEQTGVHIDFIHPTYEQMEQQLNLMMASGNYYDMLFNPSYPGGPQAAIDENCFIDLAPYLNSCMPDYKAALYCKDGSFNDWEWGSEAEIYKPEPAPSFAENMYTAKGALWAVTQIWTDAYPAELGAVIRKDWLDEAGLEMPQTLDELEVVLEAFKKRGEDVIPMSFPTSGVNGSTGAIISAFDLMGGWFSLEDDGKTIAPYLYLQPQFKDYLTLANDWYTKGYIDPDFMNRTDESLTSLFLSDRLGIYLETWSVPSYWESAYAGEQKFDAAAMPLPRKSKDQTLKFRQYYSSQATQYTCITSSCKTPEVAARWLNTGFKKEAILRASYGVEGETYELKDGVPYFTEKYFENIASQEGYNSNFLYPNCSAYYSLRAGWLSSSIDDSKRLSDKMEAALTWGENAAPTNNLGYIIFEDDDWGTMYSQYTEASTYADPMVLRFITGAESLDKFDEFVQTAGDMGFNGARDMMQAALDKMPDVK